MMRKFHTTVLRNVAATAAHQELSLSPAARVLIHNLQLDAQKIAGSGKKGMIRKEDVINFIQNGTAARTASASNIPTTPATPKAAASPVAALPIYTEPVNPHYTDIPNNNMRKVIAKRLTESKANVPHFYTSIEVNVDSVMQLRNQQFCTSFTHNNMSSLIRNLLKTPAIRVARRHADDALALGLRLTTWVIPLGLFAGWMAYPALTPGFKESLGLPSDERVVVNVKYEEVEIDQTPQLA